MLRRRSFWESQAGRVCHLTELNPSPSQPISGLSYVVLAFVHAFPLVIGLHPERQDEICM